MLVARSFTSSEIQCRVEKLDEFSLVLPAGQSCCIRQTALCPSATSVSMGMHAEPSCAAQSRFSSHHLIAYAFAQDMASASSANESISPESCVSTRSSLLTSSATDSGCRNLAAIVSAMRPAIDVKHPIVVLHRGTSTFVWYIQSSRNPSACDRQRGCDATSRVYPSDGVVGVGRHDMPIAVG